MKWKIIGSIAIDATCVDCISGFVSKQVFFVVALHERDKAFQAVLSCLVEEVEKTIVKNGMEVFHTASMKGIGGAMVLCQGLEPGLQVFIVFQFKHVLRELGKVLAARMRSLGRELLQNFVEL